MYIYLETIRGTSLWGCSVQTRNASDHVEHSNREDHSRNNSKKAETVKYKIATSLSSLRSAIVDHQQRIFQISRAQSLVQRLLRKWASRESDWNKTDTWQRVFQKNGAAIVLQMKFTASESMCIVSHITRSLFNYIGWPSERVHERKKSMNVMEEVGFIFERKKSREVK